MIVGFGRATIILPIGTQIIIMNPFLYSDSKMYLIKIIEISVNVVFIWKPKMITKRSIFLLTMDMAILK